MECTVLTATRVLRVVADKHIPGLEPLEANAAVELVRLDPADITADAVRDADALLVRTRTRCDADLLGGSRVRFVGTATIGVDHIDTAWCDANGIRWTNAPGCNAPAVAQYVLSSIIAIVGENLSGRTLGIIGVGHVGRIVARWAESLGMRVLLNDPPRSRAEGPEGFTDLDTLLSESDIVTVHTPLTRCGADATWHIADARFFAAMRRGSIFINAARGPVVDTPALVQALASGHIAHAVIDTWEGEPQNLSPELLAAAYIATPHIAGYSLQGKQRASQMVLSALYATLGLGDAPCDPSLSVIPVAVTPATLRRYDPKADTAALRADSSRFEQLRNHYPLRPEPGF